MPEVRAYLAQRLAEGPVEERGGDPACWLNRVCPRCGAMTDEAPPTTCPQCRAELPVP
jgi:rubrerythrin